MTHDVTIIGGGPAGLSAGLYLARAGLSTMIFAGSPSGGQLMYTTEVENFPGHESILGPELITKMRQQATHFGCTIIDDNVSQVAISSSPFTFTHSREQSQSKALIIATGAQAIWLDIPSEQRLRGKGVSACATCDGFFFKNKTVAVVGGGDTALEEALTLTKFAQKVYVIHRRESFRASKIMQDRALNHPKIEVLFNTRVKEVSGENKVEGVILEAADQSEKNVELQGLFIAIGHKPDTTLFKDLINLDDKGYVLTFNRLAEEYLRGNHPITHEAIERIHSSFEHYSTQTSVQGIFAAGDCVDHVYRQAGTAAGMGIMAALDTERYLATR